MFTELTQTRLQELFFFDINTGIFYRNQSSHSGRWKSGKAGGIDVHGYSTLYVDGKQYKAHRLAWLYVHGVWPVNHIDHINGIKTDNRIVNLRDVPNSVNRQNERQQRKRNKSGYMGVSPNKSRWMAQIKANGIHYHLGTYDTPEEAYAIYLENKRKLHIGNTL